uniref:Reverse transcriptase domain-containing protein n=1 Tax=Tanacetum cinerariifolium TaxID=118510 RepID=A0A6L2MQ14_TANCI|nr:hypothetical protein [Tanacetum cinerariifolium]
MKPDISNDVKFEINDNFMRELRRKLFKGTDEEDAHEHVRRVLEIADLFHFPGVTHDAVMLRVFPITLMGPTLRWKNRLLARLITTWDLLEKAFIWKYHLKKQKDNPYKTRETIYMIGIPKKIHKKKDEGEMDDGWDITIKDVEKLRKIPTPTIYTLPILEPMVKPYMPRGPFRDDVKVMSEAKLEYDIPLQNGVMQPLNPYTVHITPADDNYVASVLILFWTSI